MLAAEDIRGVTVMAPTPCREGGEQWSDTNSVDLEETALAAFLALPEMLTEARRQELVAHMRDHVVPVVQLVGVEDGDPMRIIEATKGACPNFHAVILPDSGHYPAMENPQDFNHAVLNALAGLKVYGSR